MTCSIVVIASGKGGVGKTMVTTNLGVVLAGKGKNVLLLDLNPGFRNLDICLNMENDIVYDLEDVLNSVCKVRQAIIENDEFERLSMITASQRRGKTDLDINKINILFRLLRNNYDYILVDLPTGIGKEMELMTGSADRFIIISTPEFATIRANDTLCRELCGLGVEDISLIINRIKPEYLGSEYFPTIRDVAEATDIPLLGVIQEDDNIFISTNSGIPIASHKDSYIEKNFQNIAERLG